MPKVGRQNGNANVRVREKLLISAEEAAELLGVSPEKIKKYCRERKLSGVDNGFPVAFGNHTKYLIHFGLFKAWVEERIRNGEPI